MKKRRRQSGQALTEYAFLMVLLATITFAVVVLAGNQLQGIYQGGSYELSHLTDASTVAPDGSMVDPGVTPPPAQCPPGQTAQLKGDKWKCHYSVRAPRRPPAR